MASNQTTIREQTNNKGNAYAFKTLEEFIDAELKAETDVVKKVNKVKVQVDKDRIKDNTETQKKAIKEYIELQKRLELEGIKFNNSQRKSFLIKLQKEMKTLEQQRIQEYWKKYNAESRKEENSQKRLFELGAKYYDDIAKKRARMDRAEEKIKSQNKKIEEDIAKIKSTSDNEEKKKLQDEIDKLRKRIDVYKKFQDKAEKSAVKTENEARFEETFLDAFSDLFDEIDKGLGVGNGEVWGKDLIKAMQGVGKAITDGLNQINTAISKYADYQTAINARMQGARGDTVEIFGDLEDTIRKVSYSPLIRTEDLYDNLSNLIAEGIAANVEQRAFLQTVKDGIATTFDANNSALRKIIRLQQYDSTAARLGMEAYLTSYLNALTQNTEYLQSTFDTVAESLIEASSLMTAQASTEFEYVIQKWLGTLTGLGLGEQTATSIASAVGYLGSGNINALSSSDMQNLLVMAASRSGLNYSNLLSSGLSADTANQLMYSIVTYLSELGSNKSNVVKSQLAQTFGVTISDLVAASNIVQNDTSNSTITNLYNNLLTYGDMYSELNRQMGLLREREGISNILENLFSNFTFAQGMSIASNPATYATWKITDLIQGVTGGINIPYITALGTGVDLETTVENLMKLGIVGVATIGGIGDIISGLSSAGNGSSLLGQIGISANANSNTIVRGTGYNARASGTGTSISTLVGNVSGSDYVTSTLTSAEDEQQTKLDKKKETDKTVMDELNDYIQGPQQEMYAEMSKNVKQLNKQIEDGITVKLSSDDITKLTSMPNSGSIA